MVMHCLPLLLFSALLLSTVSSFQSLNTELFNLVIPCVKHVDITSIRDLANGIFIYKTQRWYRDGRLKGSLNTLKSQGTTHLDHKALGESMQLFMFPSKKLGADTGLGPVILPRGMNLLNALQNLVRKIQKYHRFDEIRTSSMAQVSLWEQSGHLANYSNSMWSVIKGPHTTKSDNLVNQRKSGMSSSYLLKPMSCPLHFQMIFKANRLTQDILPIRVCEFGHVFRRETPSSLYGLMRMKEFIQDDGHILCLYDQVKDEILKFLQGLRKLHKAVGLKWDDAVVSLSTKPVQCEGSPLEWEKAQALLREALEESTIRYVINKGEGAFYGPKIDISYKDTMGRFWQTGTIQMDIVSAERFGINIFGDKVTKLYVLHRAICGSLERFMSIILEQTQGQLPTWLAPIQVAVLPIGPLQNDLASKIFQTLIQSGVKAELDDRQEHLNVKLKVQHRLKPSEIWVLGPKEVEGNFINIRKYHQKQRTMDLRSAILSIRRRAKHPTLF